MDNEAQDNQAVLDEQPQTVPISDNAALPNEKLDAVKRQALDALVPVIDNLQGIDPERKFDICMSAMRLSDDKNLAETALHAALAITEAGTKAEALVELINEIDYLQQP